MNNVVCFRDFEERDIDFVYKCKNDPILNKMIVGAYKPLSYEESIQWVKGCIGEHETYKFWAICTNDANKNIVGWISLSNIDRVNQSACFHGIVIGDKDYKDGNAWIESYIFIVEQVFEKYKLNRIYGCYLDDHPASGYIAEAMLFKTEGIFKKAVFKNGIFHDLVHNAMLADEYFKYKENGDLEISSVYRRLIKIIKEQRIKKS